MRSDSSIAHRSLRVKFRGKSSSKSFDSLTVRVTRDKLRILGTHLMKARSTAPSHGRGCFAITYVTIDTMKPIKLSGVQGAKEVKTLFEEIRANRARLRDLVDQQRKPPEADRPPDPVVPIAADTMDSFEPIAIDWSADFPSIFDARPQFSVYPSTCSEWFDF
jgi:hypothetical protein